MPGDRERCLLAGMDDYISKPIRRDELEAVIERCLPAGMKSRPRRRRVASATPAAGGVEDLGGVLNQAAVALIRERLTPAKFTALVDSFDRQQEQCLIEIDGAIQRGDRADVRRVAHKLRGSSASLGAIRLRDRCQQLELDRDEASALGERQIAELRVIAAEARDALRYELTR
jgi:HPt (histidine-containing phosphotransfer) domain-containing protein